jgi:hypothetical protein
MEILLPYSISHFLEDTLQVERNGRGGEGRGERFRWGKGERGWWGVG